MSHRPYKNGAISCLAPGPARPERMDSDAAAATGNHGSPARASVTSWRCAAVTFSPTARMLGLTSASRPTRSGCRVRYRRARLAPAECPSRSSRSRPRCPRSASTSSAMRSQRQVETSVGAAERPVPRGSRMTSVRCAPRPPRSPRYAESRIGPPGRQTSGSPTPTVRYARVVPSIASKVVIIGQRTRWWRSRTTPLPKTRLSTSRSTCRSLGVAGRVGRPRPTSTGWT